jgi:predicted RNase H-like HicB family nuclease
MCVPLLTAIIHREDHWVVAECPAIPTINQGETAADALKNLKEATGLYLEEFPEINLTIPLLIPVPRPQLTLW